VFNAHGFYGDYFTCVNLDYGTIITLKDIFIEDCEEALISIIKSKLAENPQELEQNYWVDDIKPNNNFYLNSEGITFVYNPYDIAAYVVGQTEVFISYSEIEAILAPESPVKRFLKP
jgi:hypothetical protein